MAGIEVNEIVSLPPAPTVRDAMLSYLPTSARVNELDAADATEEPVLFDATTVKDRATYEEPRLPAAGFESVWIGGIKTLDGGKRTSELPGRSVRQIGLVK